MRYELKIIADHDMSEDEALNVIDLLGGTHDSASVGKRVIEVDGAISDGIVGRAELILFRSKILDEGYAVESALI